MNLVDRLLEIHRGPAGRGPARRRPGYATIEALDDTATIAPLAVPAASLRVGDLLP